MGGDQVKFWQENLMRSIIGDFELTDMETEGLYSIIRHSKDADIMLRAMGRRETIFRLNHPEQYADTMNKYNEKYRKNQEDGDDDAA